MYMKNLSKKIFQNSASFYIAFTAILIAGIILSFINIFLGAVVYLVPGWWLFAQDINSKKYFLNGGVKYGKVKGVIYGVVWTLVLFGLVYLFLQSQLEIFFPYLFRR